MTHGNQKITLWAAIILYLIIFSAFSFWKYDNFLYNGRDLAIFNQVFHNSLNFFTSGTTALFDSSLQGHNYLGDHFAPIIILLLPFYLLWQDPRMLLLLQTIVLALSAIPVFYIAKFVIKSPLERGVRAERGRGVSSVRNYPPHSPTEVGEHPSWEGIKKSFQISRFRFRDSLPLWAGLAFLLNPIVHNINLFEFHLLPFAVFFLLWAFYFYLKGLKAEVVSEGKSQDHRYFYSFLFLSLLVREDVALLVGMWGLVAWYDVWRKKIGLHAWLKWSAIPLVMAGLWLTFARQVIAVFSPSGGYQFLYYYGWLATSFSEIWASRLGTSFSQIIIGAINNFGVVLKHVLTLNNFEMIIGLGLAFAFLPFFRPKYLWIALPVALAFFLSRSGGGAYVWQTHFASLFLPSLVVTAIFGLGRLSDYQPKVKTVFNILLADKTLLIIILFTIILASSIALGPVVSMAKIVFDDYPPLRVRGAGGVRYNENLSLTNPSQSPLTLRGEIKEEITEVIPKNASVASTETFLPGLSSRSRVYDLRYIYLGVQQFGAAPFELPQLPEYLVLSRRDLVGYVAVLPHLDWSSLHASAGQDRLTSLIQRGGHGVEQESVEVLVLKKDSGDIQESIAWLEKVFSETEGLKGSYEINGIRGIDLVVDN